MNAPVEHRVQWRRTTRWPHSVAGKPSPVSLITIFALPIDHRIK